VITDIAVAADGSLWLTTTGASLYHLKPDGALIAKFGRDAGQFWGPHPESFTQLDIAKDGSVWTSTSRGVIELKKNGSLAWHTSDNAVYTSPVALADGSIWVADINKQRIHHLNAEGKVIGDFSNSSECEPDKRFEVERNDYRRKIAAAPGGGLWIWDAYFKAKDNSLDEIVDVCLQHVASDGRVFKRAQFSYNIDKSSHSNWWIRIDQLNFAVAPDGSLWLGDPAENRIRHWTQDGKLLGDIKGRAVDLNAQQYGFIDVTDLELAADGTLWLSHALTGRIQHLRLCHS
jgi:outer membrane protein assembly factor BamB